MTTFSQRFNKWLAEKGEEQVSPEIAEALDSAAVKTVKYFKENEDAIVKELCSSIADLLQQEYKMHEGQWWLFSLGKPARPLTNTEIVELELETE